MHPFVLQETTASPFELSQYKNISGKSPTPFIENWAIHMIQNYKYNTDFVERHLKNYRAKVSKHELPIDKVNLWRK